MEKEDYFGALPPEILDKILGYLDGVDLGRIKQTGKFFDSLNNSVIWKSICMHRFNTVLNDIIYVENTINWKTEVSRLEKYQKTSSLKPHLKIESPKEIDHILVYKNHLVINNFALFNLQSGREHSKNDRFRLSGYKFIGPYAGQIESDLKLNCHLIYDYVNNSNKPTIARKLYDAWGGRLKSFNTTLAILENVPKRDQISVFNWSIRCRHTDDILWKRSVKKKELCNECAHLMTIENDRDKKPYDGAYCSTVNEEQILVPTNSGLRVLRPLDNYPFDIQNDDTCHLEIAPESGFPYQHEDSAKVIDEQLAKLGCEWHHIVHCTGTDRHYFYDLTTKKMIASVRRWSVYKWIPNTCYLALASGREVLVVDFVRKRVVSRFKCTYSSSYKPDTVTKVVTAYEIKVLEASRTSPVLLVGMWKIYHESAVLLYSALTGAKIATLCATRGYPGFHIKMTEDEKTLILCKNPEVLLYDLGDTFTILQ